MDSGAPRARHANRADLGVDGNPRLSFDYMTDQATATGAVVEFIGRARFADFPSEAVEIAKRCIIDGLGVLLAGSTQEAGTILHEHVRGTDTRAESTVLGPAPFKTGAAAAALVNGTSGHALDWDDTQLATSADRIFGLLTHPTIPPLVAALALGERERDLREALPRGVSHGLRGRVQDRRGDPPEPLQEGVPLVRHGRHVRRRGRGREAAWASSPAQVAHTLAIAASSASGIRVSFGSMTKPLHVGRAAQNGVVAARARGARVHGRQGCARSAVGLLPDLQPRRRATTRSASSVCSATRTRSCRPACRSSRIRAACSATRRWTRCAGS